ncbi:MAG: DUF6345 domain-containing protein [Actinomycetota bacterium]
MTMQDIPRSLIEELSQVSSRIEMEYARPAGGRMVRVEVDGMENPFAELEGMRGIGAGAGVSGAFSIEKFATAGGLTYTHEDAQGWLTYLAKFNPNNFWYKDGGVQPWSYYEDYDNWQDTYGMDAVCAVYHSGHGGMTGDGRFVAPLGAGWGNVAAEAWSDQMRLGNERARYVFWSTCLSCRVLDGQTPYRTWTGANLGFRMLFGYETVSWDNPNYGSAFWKHWNQGKSFSTAWMDASWYDVAHDQAPSAAAWGGSQAEANDRVFNERYLYGGQVSRDWAAWRWYWPASSATARRQPNLQLPSSLLVAALARPMVDEGYVEEVLSRHDAPVSGAMREVRSGAGRGFRASEGDARVSVSPEGTYEIDFARPNLENPTRVPIQQAVRTAHDFARQQGLDSNGLVFDRVLLKSAASGTEKGSGELTEPRVTETVVQFTQVINGLPVLGPGPGQASVSVDNDGRVTAIRNGTRQIEQLTDRALSAPPAPGAEPAPPTTDPERALADAWQERLRMWVVRDTMPISFTEIPGSAEIGYVIRDDQATLVARKDVEADFGGGFLKRYRVEVPIVE